jgi:hypothetical protein
MTDIIISHKYWTVPQNHRVIIIYQQYVMLKASKLVTETSIATDRYKIY